MMQIIGFISLAHLLNIMLVFIWKTISHVYWVKQSRFDDSTPLLTLDVLKENANAAICYPELIHSLYKRRRK
ncbi:TMhelix containing protein [Vibrio phage 1.081.O._10N.286.52.C2]|nr:TMhelix containing protein [Vibrio phage 1.081.O._10N.286.52.C2]